MATSYLSCPLCFLRQDPRNAQCMNPMCRNAQPNAFRLWEGHPRLEGFFRGNFENDQLQSAGRPVTTAPYVAFGQAQNVWMPGAPMGVDPRYVPAAGGVQGGMIPQTTFAGSLEQRPQFGGRSHGEGQSPLPPEPRSSRQNENRRGRGRRFQRGHSEISGQHQGIRPSARNRKRSRSPRQESSSPSPSVPARSKADRSVGSPESDRRPIGRDLASLTRDITTFKRGLETLEAKSSQSSKELKDSRKATNALENDLRKARQDRDAFKKKAEDLERKLQEAEQQRDAYKSDKAAILQHVRSLDDALREDPRISFGRSSAG